MNLLNAFGLLNMIREDLEDYFGTAMFGGFPLAIMDLSKVDEDMNRLPEVGKTEFKKSLKQNFGSRQSNIQEVDENASNYTNNNYHTYTYY